MPGDESQLAQLRSLLSAAVKASDVDALITEARGEARARVRSLLVQAFTDELLAGARDALRPAAATPVTAAPPSHTPAAETPGHTPTAETPAATPTADLGWYVYCIVDGDHPPPPPSVDGVQPEHPAHPLRHGDLSAVVSRVPLAEFGEEPLRAHLADMDWLERTARAHEHVLDTVAEMGTPIPMRLCTIYRDERGVREMLDREREALRRALGHLAGKAEWGVKAFGDAAAPLPDGDGDTNGHDTDADGDAAKGAAYMQRRLADRRHRDEQHRRLDGACASIHEELASLALEAVTSAPQRPEVTGHPLPMILNAAYLVAHDRTEAFHDRVAQLQAELAPAGIEIEATGPWPPYNFVPGAIGAAW